VGDEVLFVEEAVMLLHKKALFCKENAIDKESGVFYALESDVFLHGLNKEDIASTVQLVNYAGFVTLTEKHKVIKTWN